MSSLLQRVLRWLGMTSADADPKEPEAAEPEEPIDDGFWFGYSRELVKNALAARDKAASALQTTLGWFWTAYAAAVTIGVPLSDKDFSKRTVLIITLPVGVLLLAYLAAALAQIEPLDRVQSFQAQVANDIKQGYNRSISRKTRWLFAASILTVIAVPCVIAAIYSASLATKNKDTDFHASYHSNDGGQPLIGVTGHFPDDAGVFVIVGPPEGATGQPEDFSYVASSSGDLQVSVPVKLVADKYEVSVQWTEDKVTRTLMRTISTKEDDDKTGEPTATPAASQPSGSQ